MPRFDGDVFLLGTAISAPAKSVFYERLNAHLSPVPRNGNGRPLEQGGIPDANSLGGLWTHAVHEREASAYNAPSAKCKPRLPLAPACGKPGASRSTGETDMMFLPVTLTIAAAAALLNLWLSIRVGRIRMAEKISIGDGGSDRLIRRMRAQANFLENTGFALVLIAAIEMAVGTSTLLWLTGLVYIVGRICHAFGMDGGAWVKGRSIGTITTMAILLGLAGYALYLVYTGPTALEVPARAGDIA